MSEVQPSLYPDILRFSFRLPHLTESLGRRRKTRIVAIGSSSTVGVGTIVPFPYRLEQALRTRFYGHQIDLLNRGVSGQESPEELSRFECDVLAETPALVIWQLGTNAVFHQVDYGYDDVEDAIAVGLQWLATIPADVILMDLQFTREMVRLNADSLAKGHTGPDGTRMGFADDVEFRIGRAAAAAGVNVFRRWALMKRWYEDGVPLAEMDDGGSLHTSEWATKWVSIALDRAIGNAVGPVRGARHQTFDI
jgi:acyl-CoA thioesterase I